MSLVTGFLIDICVDIICSGGLFPNYCLNNNIYFYIILFYIIYYIFFFNLCMNNYNTIVHRLGIKLL